MTNRCPSCSPMYAMGKMGCSLLPTPRLRGGQCVYLFLFSFTLSSSSSYATRFARLIKTWKAKYSSPSPAIDPFILVVVNPEACLGMPMIVRAASRGAPRVYVCRTMMVTQGTRGVAGGPVGRGERASSLVRVNLGCPAGWR